MFIEEEDMTVQENFLVLKTMNDYNYTTNSSVAVVSDSSGEGAPFGSEK